MSLLRSLYLRVCRVPVGYFCTITETGPNHELRKTGTVFVTTGTSVDLVAKDGVIVRLTFEEA